MAPSSSRILVVDDNDALRENLVEALELEGYPVEAARDGADALERLARDPAPSVVLLDLMMPGMNGRDLLAHIRRDPRLAGMRVVIVTGVTGARARIDAADAVLTKPFGVKELLAAVEKAEG